MAFFRSESHLCYQTYPIQLQPRDLRVSVIAYPSSSHEWQPSLGTCEFINTIFVIVSHVVTLRPAKILIHKKIMHPLAEASALLRVSDRLKSDLTRTYGRRILCS
jgi:hypothetical protein